VALIEREKVFGGAGIQAGALPSKETDGIVITSRETIEKAAFSRQPLQPEHQ